MLVARLTRWQQLFSRTAGTVPHSPGRKGDRLRPDFVFLWNSVLGMANQDFIFFLVFLKVHSPLGPEMAPWCGGALGSPRWTPTPWEQRIPVAFELCHHPRMLTQCHGHTQCKLS